MSQNDILRDRYGILFIPLYILIQIKNIILLKIGVLCYGEYHFIKASPLLPSLVKRFLILSLSTYDMAYMHALNTFTGSASCVTSCLDIYHIMYYTLRESGIFCLAIKHLFCKS